MDVSELHTLFVAPITALGGRCIVLRLRTGTTFFLFLLLLFLLFLLLLLLIFLLRFGGFGIAAPI